ncbi:RNA polymerase sigma factor [Candidatus Uabimicrobium amorphum]|uniref:RNA polymerase sigma factor SigS n=1 Tax=Uabimicrobium amorphum TaxID=2596890 RepID=A0A5S9F624_UABAM|nr:sigma-70 family RNA polymerase sigma factor [Candidatus Uabimicrobium amorphum]BBM85872.1 DNA-directed RNA polymerase sigma-70 factor [Candidatus Uabimicrobium amorphum]
MKTEDEQDSDIDLEKLQRGHRDEFDKIYQKYASKVFMYAYRALSHREDAEEIIQEVFSEIWQQRQKIHSEGFIWKLVRCRCIDRLRKKKVQCISDEHLDQVYRESDIGKRLIQEEQRQKILQKISEGERQVLSLLMKGLTRQEIAELLKTPIGTIDSRLHRLKNKLKG